MKKAIITILAVSSLLVGCGSKQAYNEGTYTGTAKGLNGDIVVEVTVDTKKIKEVKVVEHKETETIAAGAFDEIPSAIVKEQTTDDIEVVSGATVASEGIIEAAKLAIEQAIIN